MKNFTIRRHVCPVTFTPMINVSFDLPLEALMDAADKEEILAKMGEDAVAAIKDAAAKRFDS